MKLLLSIVLITITLIGKSDCLIAEHNETIENVEILMNSFRTEKCLNAEYRGMIVEEIDLKRTFVFPNGYEKQIYCSPFNSTLYKELLDKVTNKAKKLQSNLICNAELVLHNDGKVFNMGNFEQMLPCFAMMSGPAYLY